MMTSYPDQFKNAVIQLAKVHMKKIQGVRRGR